MSKRFLNATLWVIIPAVWVALWLAFDRAMGGDHAAHVNASVTVGAVAVISVLWGCLSVVKRRMLNDLSKKNDRDR